MSFGMAVILKPTYACDAACEYCEVHKWGSLFAPMEIKTYDLLKQKIKDFFKDKATIKFYWLGGEPLMAGDDFYAKVLELDLKENKILKKIIIKFAKEVALMKVKKNILITTAKVFGVKVIRCCLNI